MGDLRIELQAPVVLSMHYCIQEEAYPKHASTFELSLSSTERTL